jgi:AcrR family transcriptional regulator
VTVAVPGAVSPLPAMALSPERLSSGRHQLTPEAVEADQRRRVLAAMAGALEEHGYAHATVSQVLKRAGVSRRTFYELFTDRDDCLLAAYDDAERRIWAQAAAAVASAPKDDWPRRVRAAIEAIAGFLAAEPSMGRLFTLEARAAGPAIAERHRRALDRAAALLRAGNRADRGGADLPDEAERALVANVAALAGAYVLSGATELLPGLAPQLADHLLTPYLERC